MGGSLGDVFAPFLVAAVFVGLVAGVGAFVLVMRFVCGVEERLLWRIGVTVGLWLGGVALAFALRGPLAALGRLLLFREVGVLAFVLGAVSPVPAFRFGAGATWLRSLAATLVVYGVVLLGAGLSLRLRLR